MAPKKGHVGDITLVMAIVAIVATIVLPWVAAFVLSRQTDAIRLTPIPDSWRSSPAPH